VKVSIIIPTYNTAQYVTQAVESVLQSSYTDYEILIVDDESTDDTRDVLKPYLEKYNFIKYIFQKNKGLAGARNTGIENSSGEYLVFLDSDDLILPEKLKKQVEFLQLHRDFDLCYSKSINFIENNVEHTFPADFPIFEGDVLENLWFGNFMHVNSVMVRRGKVNAVGNFNPDYRELEDWDLWLRMALSGSKFAHLPEALSMVRVRKTSMTVNQAKMDNAMVKVLQNMLPILKSKKDLYIIHKNSYHKALLLFMIKAQSLGFFKNMISSTVECGFLFIPVALKLGIKKLLKPILKNQNKTTQKLEQIWNE